MCLGIVRFRSRINHKYTMHSRNKIIRVNNSLVPASIKDGDVRAKNFKGSDVTLSTNVHTRQMYLFNKERVCDICRQQNRTEKAF